MRVGVERTFLRIARGTLIAVVAASLLFTVIAAVYGAAQFLPNEKPKVPEIAIDLKQMTLPKPDRTTESATTASTDQTFVNKPEVTKQCGTVTSKINEISRQIGWDKKDEQVLNNLTMQYETKHTVEYDQGIGSDSSGKFCKLMQDGIEEQNSKLAPYFPGVNLRDAYYRNLESFLEQVSLDTTRNRALSPDDANRYYALTSLEWFINQFEKGVDDAKERAIQKQAESSARRVSGTVALYTAGTSFAIFFTCCLVLVFIRIEVNTKDLVDVLRSLESRMREAPPEP
jgi:hypothetical protein